MTQNETAHAEMFDRILQQIAEPVEMIDYYCTDCREYFRAPRTALHAKEPDCPRGHIHNTYEAFTE